MSHKPQPKKGTVPPFFISLKTDDLIIHNCMVDYGATHDTIPFSFMTTIGLDCTRHYKARESIFSIDSRIVFSYGEIKDLCAKISSIPQVHRIFTIIVVDLPPTKV